MTGQSRFSPGAGTTYLQTSSPKVIAHQVYAGFGLVLSNGAAVVTVDAGGDGVNFPVSITLEGTGVYRYPVADQMNKLNNAAWIRVTWNTGTLRVFQKG